MPFDTIIDSVVRLLRERERTRSELFDHVVKPVFEGAELMVRQYRALFTDAKEHFCQKSTRDWDTTLSSLRKAREGYLVDRIKVSQLVEVAKTTVKDKEVVSFVYHVNRLMYPATITIGGGISAGAHLIDLLDCLKEERPSRHEITQIIQESRSSLIQGWDEVALKYARLSLNYNLPSGSTHKKQKA